MLGLGLADVTTGAGSTLVGKGVRLEAGVKAIGGSFPAKCQLHILIQES